jgi:rhodanese-related sulfurtransferase
LNRPWWWPFGRVPDIAAHELHARLQGSAPPQLIDVRSGIEWRSSRIAGAISVPVTELKLQLAELGLDRTRPVVAICLTAHRSIPAVRMLRAQGFDARQLRQGMRAWWRAGLPVERGDGESARKQ